ncbi:MAG: carboxypeptidase regulatory-like domain-containing protein [Planctomycetota bacterium]
MNRALPWIALAALVLLGTGAAVYQLTRPSAGGPDRSPRTGPGAVTADGGVPSGSPSTGSPVNPYGPSEPTAGTESPAAETAHIDGVVRTQDGRPAAAIVTATSMYGLGPVATKSGDDGLFAMDVLAGGWTVRAETPGKISTPGVVNLSVGDSAHLELTLLAAAAVVGTVTDPDGRPVEGAIVSSSVLMTGEGKSEMETTSYAGTGASAVTDANGRYRILVLPGMQSMTAQKSGFGPGFGEATAAAGGEAVCDLRLATALSISGRVLNRDGAPIEGAVVTAAWYGQGETPFRGTYSRMSATSADGRYEVQDLREGIHYLSATAPGHVQDVKEKVEAGSENVDFKLTRAGRIEGRVVRKSDGSPIDSPAVACRLVSMQAWEQNRVQVGEAGTFVVDGVGAGKHIIQARAKGFAPGQSAEFDVALGQTVTGIVVELTPGGGLRGVVRSARTKEPVAGATITRLEKLAMMDIDADTFLANPAGPCKTDEQGRFVMADVPPGSLRIRVNHADFAALIRTVDIDEGEVTEEEFLLGDAARIFGRVVDYGDRPRPGVTVSTITAAYTDQNSAQTDKDGKYELKGLAAGTYMVAIYEMGEGAAGAKMNMRTVVVKEGESVQVDFTPSDGVRLYGSVRQGGRVQSKVQLQFFATSGGGAMMSAQTDDSGGYELTGVRPGEYSVIVGKTMMKCAIPAGQREVKQDFDLPTGAVSGRVYDVRTRAKVAGAEVQAYRTGGTKGGMADFLERYAGSATSDEEGAYELSGLDPGEYVLQVSKEGYAVEMTAPFAMPADGNVGGMDFLLSGGAKIEGIVLDDARRPVTGATFSLRDRKTGTIVAQTEVWSAQSDENGRFSLPGVRAGEYVFGVHSKGHASAQRVVRVAAGRDATIEVVLPAAGTIRVRVSDAAGGPVVGATLALIDAEGNPVESSVGIEDLLDPSSWKTGEDGRIERGGIAPGHYRGELTEGARKAQFEADIVAGQVAEVGVVIP